MKHGKPNEPRLLSFGFEKRENEYVYMCDIVDGQMSMAVTVSRDGKISAEVTDRATNEEYVLHRVPDAQGSFVGRVREAYDGILDEIYEKCFDAEVFGQEQTKEIIDYFRGKYGDELEYLWQKFTDNAIVRRKDNQKWYAAILTVSRRKLGFDSDEKVEIIDLRINPEDMDKTVDDVRYFRGYHMNKKHWITICLDGTVSSEEIFARIDNSYDIAGK